MDNYLDIIEIDHYEPSIKHPRMSIYNRSAQFAPFSALVGYDEVVKEVAREVDKKVELDDCEKNKINNILLDLTPNEEIIITYFVQDKKKNGGYYFTKKINFHKIDFLNKNLIFSDNLKIPINSIIDIKKTNNFSNIQ